MVMVMYKVNFVLKNEVGGGGEGGWERGLVRFFFLGFDFFVFGCMYMYFVFGFGFNEYLFFK